MLKTRTVHLTVIVIIGLATSVVTADEKQKCSKVSGPLEIIQDCIKAVEAGDFERYVDHLSPDEQKLQVGYVLFMTSMISQAATLGSDGGSPETFLLGRALGELVSQHTVEDDKQDVAHNIAKSSWLQLSGVLVGSMSAYGQTPKPQPLTADIIRQSTGVLKDHRQFLIAVLSEINRPTQVSGEKPANDVDLFEVGGVVEVFKKVKWTLYTRGKFAMAVAVKPAPVEPPKTDSPPEYVAAPEPSLSIEFRRIDGHWKIHRLLPSATFVPTINTTACQPYPSSYAPVCAPPPGTPPLPPSVGPYGAPQQR